MCGNNADALPLVVIGYYLWAIVTRACDLGHGFESYITTSCRYWHAALYISSVCACVARGRVYLCHVLQRNLLPV